MKNARDPSRYLCYLLRHNPAAANLDMDCHGWVDVKQIIDGVNTSSGYSITFADLKKIVAEDQKGRYCFNSDESKIKACQGHSLPWIELELMITQPPAYLYHGTNTEAFQKIMSSGFILRMNRHAVHMQADVEKAWQSARRWKGKTPVVLKIAAEKLWQNGTVFGVTENGVWCCESVPTEYIEEFLYEQKEYG